MHGLTHSDLFRQQALSQWRLAKERSALLWRWHELIGKQIPVHGGMSLDMAGNRHFRVEGRDRQCRRCPWVTSHSPEQLLSDCSYWLN